MDGPVVILDNGAYSIKSGLSTSSTNEAKWVPSSPTHHPSWLTAVCASIFNRVVPNAIVRSKGDKRLYIGPEILECRDYVSLHYRLPFDKVRLRIFLDAQLLEIRYHTFGRAISTIGTLKRPSGTPCFGSNLSK